jgi:hypothetical protein
MGTRQTVVTPRLLFEPYGESPNNKTIPTNTLEGEKDIPALCDPRLEHLRISYWTSVPIGNTLASQAISLYLETDHPLLGLFEPSLFISDLVDQQDNFCSPVLVNALLYWACVCPLRRQRIESETVTNGWLFTADVCHYRP